MSPDAAGEEVCADILANAVPNDPTDDTEATETFSTPGAVGDTARAENQRTRRVYDADGNIVAVYEPRAFYTTGTSDPIGDPAERFLTRIDWDRQSRPVAEWRPYWDNRAGSDWSTIADGVTEQDECPTTSSTHRPDRITAVPNFPTNDVGVCVTRVSYDPAGNLASVLSASAGAYDDAPTVDDDTAVAGDSDNAHILPEERDPDDGPYTYDNRFESRTYTDDNLPWIITRPNPAYSNNPDWRDGATPGVDALINGYDGSARLVSARDAVGWFEIAEYTADGLLAEKTGRSDANTIQHRTTTDYNAAGMPTMQRQFTDPANNHDSEDTETTYTADGLVETVTQDPTGLALTHSYGYDPAGNPTAVTDPKSATTSQTFTDDNLLASTTVPINSGGGVRRTVFGYDRRGSKTAQRTCTLPSSAGEDCSGAASGDDAGTQRFLFNRDGSMRQEIGRDDTTIGLRYHADGARFRSYDTTSGVRVQNFTYLNGWDRSVTSTAYGTYPGHYEDHQTDYAYFGDGEQRARYTFDEGESLMTVEEIEPQALTDARQPEEYHAFNWYFDAPLANEGLQVFSWQRQYDAAGREVWEAAGERETPDPPPSPSSEPGIGGLPLTVRYVERNVYGDGDGMVTQRRIEDIVDESGTGGPASTELGVWDYTYDGLNRQTRQDYDRPTLGEDDTWDYGYDGAGRASTITSTEDNQPEPPDPPIPPVTHDYAPGYDDNGNRTGYDGSTYTHNPDNTVANVTADGTTLDYEYTPFGAVADDACSSYTYDGFDRLTEVEWNDVDECGGAAPDPGEFDSAYLYDGLDRQVRRTEENDPLAVYYVGTTDWVTKEDTGDYQTRTRYYVNAQGETEASHAEGKVKYLHDDGHGNIALATGNDDQGTITDPGELVECDIRYDPWGRTNPPDTGTTTVEDAPSANPCEDTDNDGEGDGDSPGNVLYRDTRRDPQTGNYQWGTRTYDPDDATWLQADTTRGPDTLTDQSITTDPLTNNRYNYVNGDPVNLSDPSGHEPCPKDGCAGSGANEARYRSGSSERHQAAASRQRHYGMGRRDLSSGYNDASGDGPGSFRDQSSGGGFFAGVGNVVAAAARGAGSFADGAWDSGWEMGKTSQCGSGAAILLSHCRDMAIGAVQLGQLIVDDPGEGLSALLGAVANVDDLEQNGLLHWLGGFAPDVAIAIATAGGGTTAQAGARAGTESARAGRAARLLDDLAPQRAPGAGGSGGPDFVAGPVGSQPPVPVSQSRMATGLDRAGFPRTPTSSPGFEYTLPDGSSVRLMTPSGQAPRRASFTNANGGPINPFTGKPVQPPAPAGWSMKDWVRSLTHVEQTP